MTESPDEDQSGFASEEPEHSCGYHLIIQPHQNPTLISARQISSMSALVPQAKSV